jgi:hypothetical protein
LLQHHSRAASAFAIGRDDVSKGPPGSGKKAAVLSGPFQFSLSHPTYLFSAESIPRTHMSKRKKRRSVAQRRAQARHQYTRSPHIILAGAWFLQRGWALAACEPQHGATGALGFSPPHNLNPKLQGVGRARQGRAGQGRAGQAPRVRRPSPRAAGGPSTPQCGRWRGRAWRWKYTPDCHNGVVFPTLSTSP